MLILSALLALVGGFLTMALLVGVATAVLMKWAPDWVGATGRPGPAYIAVNLGYSFLAAIAGGYVTAWIAKDNPLIHVLVLALTVLLLSALSAVQQRGRQPIWYQLTLLAMTPVGVFVGGWVRLKVIGLL
jgi:hypothetical protein